jgi:hypothetical protein
MTQHEDLTAARGSRRPRDPKMITLPLLMKDLDAGAQLAPLRADDPAEAVDRGLCVCRRFGAYKPPQQAKYLAAAAQAGEKVERFLRIELVIGLVIGHVGGMLAVAVRVRQPRVIAT